MLELLRASCPFPTIGSNGDRRDGIFVPQAKKCGSCKHMNCRLLGAIEDGRSEPAHAVCEHGYSCVRLPTSEGTLILNGLFVPGLNTALPRDLRKKNRSQKVRWEQIEEYFERLESAGSEISQVSALSARQIEANFHDIVTAVTLVWRKAENAAATYAGRTFDERSNAAPDRIRGLLKAADLLRSRLKLVSLLSNPKQATFGNPHPMPVYKVFDRMVRLFQEEGASNGVTIQMKGRSDNMPSVYDSFETIPLVLIDNAVKYSSRGSGVEVEVYDSEVERGACEVAVTSLGPVVDEAEAGRIFERGYRGANVERGTALGSGLGLFLARLVARAHGTEIHYTSERYAPNAFSGKNRFTVRARPVRPQTGG